MFSHSDPALIESAPVNEIFPEKDNVTYIVMQLAILRQTSLGLKVAVYQCYIKGIFTAL